LNIFVLIFQRVFFEFPVFHPVVDSKTGELDVKREFKKWRYVLRFQSYTVTPMYRFFVLKLCFRHRGELFRINQIQV